MLHRNNLPSKRCRRSLTPVCPTGSYEALGLSGGYMGKHSLLSIFATFFCLSVFGSASLPVWGRVLEKGITRASGEIEKIERLELDKAVLFVVAYRPLDCTEGVIDNVLCEYEYMDGNTVALSEFNGLVCEKAPYTDVIQTSGTLRFYDEATDFQSWVQRRYVSTTLNNRKPVRSRRLAVNHPDCVTFAP